jgi:hypothetical protein
MERGKIILKPLSIPSITKMIHMIIGKNHDFCAGELSVLWSEVIATGVPLAKKETSQKYRLIFVMICMAKYQSRPIPFSLHSRRTSR